MYKPVVIMGQTGSGKTTLAEALVEEGYERIVTYTTRSKREHEKNGVSYHFVTKDEFKNLFARDFFAEIATYNAEFGYAMYGSAKHDYTGEKKKVIVLNPDGYKELVKLGIEVDTVLLDLPTNTIIKRVIQRGDDLQEVHRRLNADEVKFKELAVEGMTVHVRKSTNIHSLKRRVLREINK